MAGLGGARFSTPAPLNMNALMSGRPITPWGRRNANQTRAILIQAGVPEDIVNIGTFDQMNPRDAALWVLQHRKETEAFESNQKERQVALQMLAREVGDIPPELQEQFLAEGGTTNMGSRLDELRADVMRRNALARSGYTAQQTRSAQQEAARSGQPLTEGDRSAIASRGAVITGRQLGTDLGQLGAMREGYRQQSLGSLTNLLTNYPQEVEGMPNMPPFQSPTIRIGNLNVPTGSYGGGTGNRWGAALTSMSRRRRTPRRSQWQDIADAGRQIAPMLNYQF